MILKNRIPQEFYKLFRTQNMDCFMAVLVAVYEENSEYYTSLGLTEHECRAIISEELVRIKADWIVEVEEDAEEMTVGVNASAILSRLINWGWLRSDYDEKLNANVISFPEYSQLYVELFRKLMREDDSQERESILSVYSALYTYDADREKNNDILKNALQKSRSLGQLLTNMQDGMRSYFDELSKQKEFLGIQEVLIDEMNNKDSRKYAILTTTDSFYRYKEAVKELISKILEANELRKSEDERTLLTLEKDSVPCLRMQKRMQNHEEASRMVYLIEREFDLIEKKYNKLIEQKTIFAGRAAARIRYILQEGAGEQDNTIVIINLLGKSGRAEEILESLQSKMCFSAPYRGITESSLYARRERAENEFRPEAAVSEAEPEASQLEDFVPRPLYTKKQIQAFMEKNKKNGVFQAGRESVQNIEDLEKLLFVWQYMTKDRGNQCTVELGEEIQTIQGYTFTNLKITED